MLRVLASVQNPASADDVLSQASHLASPNPTSLLESRATLEEMRTRSGPRGQCLLSLLCLVVLLVWSKLWPLDTVTYPPHRAGVGNNAKFPVHSALCGVCQLLPPPAVFSPFPGEGVEAGPEELGNYKTPCPYSSYLHPVFASQARRQSSW